ncbi:hypothetical protein MTO96_019539, partial [Rhipicephalus appendiculatus]
KQGYLGGLLLPSQERLPAVERSPGATPPLLFILKRNRWAHAKCQREGLRIYPVKTGKP